MSNLHSYSFLHSREVRSQVIRHQPCVIWFTGLSGAGKSTIASLVEQLLIAAGCQTHLLDGDDFRETFGKDLGFSDSDRSKNIRRAAEVAKITTDAGLIAIAAFISPFRKDREMARRLVGETKFIEVFVEAPLALAESRDPKGLYKRARRGDLKNFTGIDSPYETPLNPELSLDTVSVAAPALAQMVLDRLKTDRIIADAL